MAKTQRLRKHLKRYLSEQEPQTTGQLLTRYNKETRHGSTMAQIGNILGQDPSFFSDGVTEAWDRGVRIRQAYWYLIE